MNKERLLKNVQQLPEMDPDKHDGSYELMRETVLAYSRSDITKATYLDLNALYAMALLSSTLNVEKKKEYIQKGTLSTEEKKRICVLIDKIWDNACHDKYDNENLERVLHNKPAGSPSVGLFGTGFLSFKDKTTDKCAQDFIGMCVDIFLMSDDDSIYDRCEQVLNSEFSGMGSASASVILHCLKPTTFPILNNNMDNDNIFVVLGIKLDKPAKLETYIDNCRLIKAFRDENVPFKNYRIFDLEARKLSEYEEDDFWPSYDEYPVDLTKDDWKRFVQEVEFPSHKGCMRVLKCYVDIGGTASPLKMSETYKGHPNVYTSSVTQTCRRALKFFELDPCPDEKNNTQWFFPIAFQGKHGTGDNKGTYVYRMRKELMEAIKEMNLDIIDLEYKSKGAEEMNNVQFDKNMILYGPPGTGKTYNSVIYSVAICDGRDLKEVEADPYSETMQRYNELKEDGRIAFTTFHQSYGYEEFIEGIKPKLDDDSETLGYSIEDGVFKDFCRHANTVNIRAKGGTKIKNHPRIWVMILGGPDMTPLKKECFDKNEVRIGWSEVEDGQWDDDENISWRAKQMLHAFTYEMEPGDVVFIEKNSHSIDAIGVIAGDYECDNSLGEYPRKRKVEWIAKDIDEDMVQYLPRGKKQLARFTVYSVDYLGTDVLSEILRKYIDEQEMPSEPQAKPYVFIIDEINRGNISKIFGELITLIEDTKRAGASEAMEATLPYSGESFSVPDNVYLLGTMNTADRSIALMDTALRRRFRFVEMMPNSEVLKSLGAGTIEVDGVELDVAKMLDVMNARIEYLFDREHTIGHAFFTKLKDDATLDALADIFEKNVIPLLQEYFYEDYEKIQLVLGDNGKEDQFKFIGDRKLEMKEIFNGSTEIDIPEKGYFIQHEAFRKLESYKGIGKDL